MGFRESIASSSRAHRSRVVLALDLTGPPETRAERGSKLLRRLASEVAAVKVNYHLLLPGGVAGLRGVAEVCARGGLPLIADIKLNDIESTNLEAVGLLFDGGFDAVIANPFVGYEEGLSGVVSRAKETGKGVILLVYMSHAGAREGYGLRAAGGRLYRAFARRARRWGVDGAVVSSKSPAIISEVRRILERDQLIFSPGIGVQGGEAGEAVRAGTDYAIVGRSIVEAKDPLSSLRAFNRALALT